jgi:hypothetical protein
MKSTACLPLAASAASAAPAASAPMNRREFTRLALFSAGAAALSAAGAALSAAGVNLAPPAKAQSGLKPKYNVRFSVVALDETLEGVFYGTKGNYTPFIVPVYQKPAPVRYSGPGPIEIVRPAPAGKGDGTPIPLAEITPPALNGDFLILLKQTSKTPERYQAMIVPDDLSPAALANSWTFFNFAPANVALVFAEADTLKPLMQVQLAPGKSFTKKLEDRTTHYDGKLFQLLTDKQGKPEWKQGYSSRFFHNKGGGKLHLIFVNPDYPTRLQVKALPAIPEKPPKAKSNRTGTRPASPKKSTTGTRSTTPKKSSAGSTNKR